MGSSGFQQSANGPLMAPVVWLGTLEVLAAGLMVWGLIALLSAGLRTRRRRRAESLQAERLRNETEALKERLRYSLLDPSAWFVDPVRAGPIMGASEAFEDDIEAAARTVLLEAGGRRAKAKQLLRARASGNGSATHPNGSGVAYWRQLGALSLLDDTPDAAAAYARAADLAPDDPQAQMLAGIMHLRAGKLSAAEAAFQR